MKFTNKNSNKKPPAGHNFYKPGNTFHENSLDRYDNTIDDSYKKSSYSDWNIEKMFELRCSKDVAIELEKYFQQNTWPYEDKNYKKNVEKYYGKPFGHYTKDTGVSELRLVKDKLVTELIQILKDRTKDWKDEKEVLD